MKSLIKEKRYDLIDAFNSTSRYLDDLLNIQLLKAYRIKFQKFAAHEHKDVLINETFIPT